MRHLSRRVHFAILVYQVGQILQWYDESAAGTTASSDHLYRGILRKVRHHHSDYPLHVQPLEPDHRRLARLCVGSPSSESPGLTPVAPREVLAARRIAVAAFLIYVEI